VWKPTHLNEVKAAVDDVRRALDRLIDLGFPEGTQHTLSADGALETIRYVMTDAILAAFPRAEDYCKRCRLIRMIDTMSPPDHEEARALHRRLGAEDPHPDVRRLARRIHRNLEDRAPLEAELYRLLQMGEDDRGPSWGPWPTGGYDPADGPLRGLEQSGCGLRSD
jgi:hypothetical protein